MVFSNRKDDRFRSLQIDPDVSADLLQRYFAELGIVLRREDALLGVEQALLRLAHLDAGQIAQQVTLHGDFVVLAGGDQVLGFELDHFEVVAVGLPEIRQIRHERLLQLLTGQFGVFDRDPGVALLAAAVAVEDRESQLHPGVQPQRTARLSGAVAEPVVGISVPGGQVQIRVEAQAMLINLDEFEGMSGRELNIFKDLVTRKVISIRLPYARRSQNFPHTASFAGTCNYQEVLHDTTGNRRFLCFHVDSMEFIKINYAQLYAQIKYLLNKPGYQYWFTQSENSRIEENNEDFIFHSPEEELVLTHIRKPERFEKVHYLTVTEIAELIRERTGYQYSHGTKAQLGKVMSKHGFEFHKGKNGRRYAVFIIDAEQVKSNRLYE